MEPTKVRTTARRAAAVVFVLAPIMMFLLDGKERSYVLAVLALPLVIGFIFFGQFLIRYSMSRLSGKSAVAGRVDNRKK